MSLVRNHTEIIHQTVFNQKDNSEMYLLYDCNQRRKGLKRRKCGQAEVRKKNCLVSAKMEFMIVVADNLMV